MGGALRHLEPPRDCYARRGVERARPSDHRRLPVVSRREDAGSDPDENARRRHVRRSSRPRSTASRPPGCRPNVAGDIKTRPKRCPRALYGPSHRRRRLLCDAAVTLSAPDVRGEGGIRRRPGRAGGRRAGLRGQDRRSARPRRRTAASTLEALTYQHHAHWLSHLRSVSSRLTLNVLPPCPGYHGSQNVLPACLDTRFALASAPDGSSNSTIESQLRSVATSCARLQAQAGPSPDAYASPLLALGRRVAATAATL